MPDFGDVPDGVREALESLVDRNRRDMRRHSRAFAGEEWTGGLLEGLYVAGALRGREHVNRVAAAIRGDVMDTLVEDGGPR